MATLLSSQSAVAVTLASYAAAAYGSSSGGAAISPAAWPIPEPVSARPGILASVATATAIRGAGCSCTGGELRRRRDAQ